MKNGKLTALLVAAVCIGLGLVLILGALAAIDFELDWMHDADSTTTTYTIEEAFTDISIKGAECDIRLLPSEDGVCKVVCRESDKIYHTVTVKNSTLTVRRIDSRKWFERISLFNWGKMEIAVYLPESAYASLHITGVSGNIEVPRGFSFVSAELHNTSGDISCSAAVREELSAKTVSGKLSIQDVAPKRLTAKSTSGKVTVSAVKVEAAMEVETVSGKIELTDIRCQTLAAESTSGKLVLSEVVASEDIRVKSVSADVELRGCDGDTLWIKTTSGRVTGTLLTEKIFITKTSSGRVDVPRTTSGGTCEITTTSGDIMIAIA